MREIDDASDGRADGELLPFDERVQPSTMAELAMEYRDAHHMASAHVSRLTNISEDVAARMTVYELLEFFFAEERGRWWQ